MHIHCFQHVPFENPGTILDWIEQNNHTISYTYFFEHNYALPLLESYDCLLVMGGPMNVYEEGKFPWLKEEKQMIRQAIDGRKKVMGICLGSQLIVVALNKNVFPGAEKEIGFFPVTFCENALQHWCFSHLSKEYTLFHWHGDIFNLPDGACLIASTNVCPHQAYIINDTVLGLQFHLEMNEKIIEELILHDGIELDEEGTYIQSPNQIRSGYRHLSQNKKDMFLILDKFFVAGFLKEQEIFSLIIH